MQSYKDLLVFKKSYEQAVEMYGLTKSFPREEMFGLASQIRRAAVSIPLNIAEGYGKVEKGKELVRFLSMAKGSSAEMEVLLDLAKDIGYLSDDRHRQTMEKQEEVGKMLTGLIRSVQSKT